GGAHAQGWELDLRLGEAGRQRRIEGAAIDELEQRARARGEVALEPPGRVHRGEQAPLGARPELVHVLEEHEGRARGEERPTRRVLGAEGEIEARAVPEGAAGEARGELRHHARLRHQSARGGALAYVRLAVEEHRLPAAGERVEL